MEEGLRQAGESPGPHVPINSERRDLRNNAKEKRVPQALIENNELIRDYIAEMRQRNQTVCSRFALSESDVCYEGHNLSPLCVPNFCPWWSPNCFQDIPSGSSTPLDEVVLGASSSQNLVRVEESSSVEKEQIGDKDDSVKYRDVEDNYQVNSQTCCRTKEATAYSKDKRGGRNRFADKTELISGFRKRFNRTTECSYVVPEAEAPCRYNISENASSGRDGLVHRRKRMVRSLADLIVEERNPVTELSRQRPTSSTGIQSTSTEREKVLRHQNKRKASDEDDKEPSGGVTDPGTPPKEFAGLMVHEGRLFRSIPTAASEGKTNMYVPVNLEFGMNMQNELARAVDNEKAPMPDLRKMDSTPIRKLQRVHVSGEGDFSNSRDISSSRGKTELKRPRSRKPMGRMPIMPKSRNAEVEARRKHSPPRNITLGDPNNKGRASLNLSFNNFSDGKPEQSQFRLFSSNIPCGKTQNAASSSITTGVQNHTQSADLLWRAGSSSTHSYSNHCHKGKTVSDIKGLEDNRVAENPKNNRSGNFAGFRYGVSWPYKNTGLFQGQIPMEQGTSSTGINLNVPNERVFQPEQIEPGSEVGTLNRNPADFSTPDARKSRYENVVDRQTQGKAKKASGRKHTRK